MPLRYVLDEHLRGPLWDLLYRHNLVGIDPIDLVRVGDPPDLPLGTSDPDLLLWAERETRILVSEDKSTMPAHLTSHLVAGHYSPGVMTPRSRVALRTVSEFLVVAAYASGLEDWENRITFIP
jgi:hypothetical protein